MTQQSQFALLGKKRFLPFFMTHLLGAFNDNIFKQFAKDALIRKIKLAEIFIMLAGAAGVLLDSLPLMLGVLFAMGTQSALFGPVKYSILPQHLQEQELVGGNALVEMGTFLAILAGTIGAGVMMASSSYAPIVAASVVGVALLGYLASQGIPKASAAMPELQLDWNIFRQSWVIMKLGLGQRPAVSRSLVGNSWFWFLGAIYLTQIKM